MPNAGDKARVGLQRLLPVVVGVDFIFARGDYAAGRGVAGLFCIILVIADSFGLRGGFCGAAPITRIM